ncbi:histone deacetylase hda2-like protein [Leptotrombidium deliense]|uniref:Histone deacetylase hda2-like protein n=1 Tax=Leptotrombidium deliense TaxID=299467 RepID=A0A443SQK3_9ACAR|nr:histone deacetylase hda2-like protein [Leptotrombidium deliense]
MEDALEQLSKLTKIKFIASISVSCHRVSVTLRTGLVYDERMIDHYCLWDPNYPECPERFSSILSRITELDLVKRCERLPIRRATEDEILLVHEKQYFDSIQKTAEMKDESTFEEEASKYDAVYFNSRTFELAMNSAGCVLNLVESVVNNKLNNGFALIRPPGHHAMTSEACGYCFFNNVAIAAKYAQQKLGVKRVLIVDWDVHHGQATQYTFYDDPNVLYFSFHRYDEGSFWPELIESNYNFVGAPNAKGFNVNVPLNEEGLHNGDFLAIWTNVLLPIAYQFNPELVLISAGYDAAIGCPEGQMRMTPAMYSHLCHLLMPLANGKMCVLLEGGYCIPSLSEAAALTLKTLVGDPCPLIEPIPYPLHNAVVNTILDVIWAQRPFWKALCIQGRFEKGDALEGMRRRRQPVVEYKGKIAFMEKPSKYPTRGTYYVNPPEVKAQLEKEIEALKANTNLKVPNQRTAFVSCEESKHKISSHPERPARTSSIFSQLKSDDLLSRCLIVKDIEPTAEDILELVHSPFLLDKLQHISTMTDEEILNLSSSFQDVYIKKESYNIAKLAVGGLLRLVDLVMQGKCLNGFANIRPPGHHASPDKCSGFCILNNVAIAAKYAMEKYNLQRILIVDWDVHHGDGIQEVAENDDRILYISLHRYEYASFFPCTLKSGYKTSKKNVVNIPWNNGVMSDSEYLLAFFNVVLPIAYEFNPELVLVSSGFDAAERDPLGGYNLSPLVYGHFTHLLSSLANGKMIVALEGGYNLQSIAKCASNVVSVLLGDPPEMLELFPLNPSAIDTVRDVIEYQASFWSSLAFSADLPNTEVTD